MMTSAKRTAKQPQIYDTTPIYSQHEVRTLPTHRYTTLIVLTWDMTLANGGTTIERTLIRFAASVTT